MQPWAFFDRHCRRDFAWFAAGWFLMWVCPPSFAQTVSARSQTASVTGSVASLQPLEVVDLPFALADGLIRELRNGGHTLYLRHGSLLPNTVDKLGAGEWWKDCQNTRRVGPEVQAQMRAVAEALSRQRIAIHEVLSSEYCRAYDTAVLLGAAAPQRTAALNEFSTTHNKPVSAASTATYVASIEQLLTRPHPPKANRVLVGHILPPTSHPALTTLPEGHTAVFKTGPGNNFHYITTLSPGQWQSIGKQNVTENLVVIQPQVPQVIAATSAPPNVALIDSSKERKGAALVTALRKGGFNLYMRHALSNVGQDGNLMQTPQWWDNCAIQRNIADAGRDQARKVGAAMQALKIPISQVLTAQFCRTRDTGYAMGLGPIEITETLNHQIGQRVGFDGNAARLTQLAERPAKGTNRLLISHTHGSLAPQERIMGSIQEAEIIVYQPDGKGSSEPVARIPIAEWENLTKTGTSFKP